MAAEEKKSKDRAASPADIYREKRKKSGWPADEHLGPNANGSNPAWKFFRQCLKEHRATYKCGDDVFCTLCEKDQRYDKGRLSGAVSRA